MKSSGDIKWEAPIDTKLDLPLLPFPANINSSGNEIFFTGYIDQTNIESLIREFHRAVKDLSRKDNLMSPAAEVKIWLFIDSPGGKLKDAFKFIDFVKIMKKNYTFELNTVCCGFTASAATLIAIIGDKRYVTELSSIMIHELFGGTWGTYTQISSAMKMLEVYHKQITSIYLNNNKRLSAEGLSNLLKNETWFSAQEYIAAGFADEIIQ